MADFPAMPLWTDAYLADTMHLSDAEHGRYLKLLMHMWRAPGCRFPADRAWLERKTRRTPEQFDSEIQPLLDEFFQCDGNWWTQKKLLKVWQQVQATRQKQADRAKSRWEKENRASRGNATKTKTKTLDSESLPNGRDNSQPSELETSTVPSTKPKTRRKHEYPEAFQQFWLAYPKRSTDTKAGAFKAWDKARKAGTDVEALYAGAQLYAAYAGQTGCETAHVQTWINREGWTASYSPSRGNGHARPDTGRRQSAIQMFHARHSGARPDSDGAHPPVAEDEPPGRG